MPAASPGYDAQLIDGDLPLSGGLITGSALTVQRVGRRIGTHLNEALVDRFAGIDWLAWFQTLPLDIPTIIGFVREQIDTCPGIARTLTLSGVHDARTFTVTLRGSFALVTGETVELTAAVGGANGNPALLTLLLQPAPFFA